MTRRRSRSVRTSFVTVLFAVATMVGGCGNDFDALFANQTSPGANDGGTTTDGARPPDAGSSEVDAASNCEAPTACSPQVICAGNTCTNTCTGCACSCPAFECGDDDGDTDSCITTCREGTSCSATCSAEKDCTLIAEGAIAELTCDGRIDRCSLTCTKGASCELTCDITRGDARCSATCDATSSCVVDCVDSPTCDVDCQGGKKQACPRAGIFTCNRDCPT